MRGKVALVVLGTLALGLLAFAPGAEAFKVICPPGSGLGQCSNPQDVAVDSAQKRLYVADTGHNRIEVFNADTGTFIKAFGSAGAGGGQFSGPRSIAVDPSSHDLYVVDFGNRRVEKFDEEGNFILAFGGGVDVTTPGDVCTAVSGDICGAGSNGFGEGEFSGDAAIPVGVGPAGTVYVADSLNLGFFEGLEQFESRVQVFEPSGGFSSQHLLGKGKATDMAVASSGVFYFKIEVLRTKPPTSFSKYDGSFNKVFEFSDDSTAALAVDGGGNLFAAEGSPSSRNIVEYSPATPPVGVRRFGYGSIEAEIHGLAPYENPPNANANGDIYAAEGGQFEGGQVIDLDFPPPGPLVLPQPCEVQKPIGNTKATLLAEVIPEGKASEYRFEYLTQAQFEAGGFANPGTVKTAFSPIQLKEPGNEAEELVNPQKVSAKDVAVVPETKYVCRAVAKNADGENTGAEGSFKTAPPFEFRPAWAVDVKSDSAQVNAELNPVGIAASGLFEYVEDAKFQVSGYAEAIKTPEFSFGAGSAFVKESAVLSGLNPGTVYHYRLLAKDSFFEEGRVDPEHPDGRSFRTYPTQAAGTPDGRRYELVSPGQKNSAEVGIPGLAAGLFEETFTRPQAAAPDGETATYTSWTSFGEPEGAPGTSQYLARRTAGGWVNKDISPFGFQHNPANPPFHGFSPDLTFAAVEVSEPSLAESCPEGSANLYLRENASGALQCVTTEVPVIAPEEKAPFCTGYAGTSADGSRVFFAANAKLTADAPVGKRFNLYEWTAGEGKLKLVSILPGAAKTPASPNPETSFGEKGGGCSMGERRPAISSDGTRAYWTFVPSSASEATKLLVRVNGETTIQVDARKTGATGKSGGGIFEGMSADGSLSFFTDVSKLTPGAGAGDLFRFDLNAPEGEGLTDLTPEALTPGTEAANVQGVVGTSKDGAYVYFVANGILSEEANGAGQKAKAGEANLYLFHAGEGVRFVATLASDDELDWNSAPRSQSARVSADGRHLAFVSIETEELAGDYDNTIAEGTKCRPTNAFSNGLAPGPHCPEAFLYDAESKELTCASCNPSGSRPLGPTQLPGASNPYEGPRYLTADGSRLYFESRDALLPEDENQKRDVYEFERSGSGSCSAESPSFDPRSDGCIYFVTDPGESEDESYLLDASADGRDVFIATLARPVGWDVNENYDVYDFRAGGGFPEPEEAAICKGEGCKPPASLPPAAPAPTTPSFQGPGNVKPKKPKHRKKHSKHKSKRHSDKQGRR